MIPTSNGYVLPVRSFETHIFTFRGQSFSASLKNGHGIPPELWGISSACGRKHKKRK